MAAPRFFVSLDLAPAMVGATLDLPGAALHHATRVVRLVVGDSLTLFNGLGGEYAATITRIDKRGASVRQMLGRPGEAWGAESGNDRLVVVRY